MKVLYVNKEHCRSLSRQVLTRELDSDLMVRGNTLLERLLPAIYTLFCMSVSIIYFSVPKVICIAKCHSTQLKLLWERRSAYQLLKERLSSGFPLEFKQIPNFAYDIKG